MRRRKSAALLIIIMMTAAAFLPGCGTGQDAAQKDGNTAGPGGHEAYGISYDVPETDWIYMLNAEQLGTGEEWFDLEISGHEGKPSPPKDSYKQTVDGRECCLYGDAESKTLLIPQADGNKYIEIRNDFVQDPDKTDAFFKELIEGLEYTDDEGYIACKEYISVGGVRIPARGLKPAQFFYGLMDEEATDGLVSVQIDFHDDAYSEGVEKLFDETGLEDSDSLLDDGAIRIGDADGKWYTYIDSLAGSMTYMSHVIMIPVDELQTIMCISYDFDAEVDDLSRYEERIKEIDARIGTQIQAKLDGIRESGVLKVGTAGDYMPVSYLDPETGNYVGFDAELAEDLADSLDVDLEYVETSWPTLMDDTLAGKFDLAMCGITITDARKEQALMSDGYFENGKTLLCRAEDADRFTSLEAINLPEVRVMENPGGTNEKFARENLPDATLIIHEANQEIPGLVASGEADVMITEVVEAGYYVGQDDRLAAPLIFEPFTKGELGVLMPKGSEDLLDYVNDFLAKEKGSGRIDELAEEYFFKYVEYDEELRPAA